jgi:hypothetical protein
VYILSKKNCIKFFELLRGEQMRDNSLITLSFHALLVHKTWLQYSVQALRAVPPHHYLSAAQPCISISCSQPPEFIFVTRQNASRRIDRTQLFGAPTPYVWDPSNTSFVSSGTDVNFRLICNERESVFVMES